MNATRHAIYIPCRYCNTPRLLMDVDPQAIADWFKTERAERPLVQDAFPDMSSDDREMLVSQTCPPCWDSLFPVEEDDAPIDEDEPAF